MVKMKALISKLEKRKDGYRVAQVAADNEIFNVSNDLYWIDCPNEIEPDMYWYNETTNEFVKFQYKLPLTEEEIEILRQEGKI